MPRVTITVPDQSAQPYRFQLDRQVVSIGRGSDNDIVIDSGSVSGKHAEMHRIEGGYELRDLGSTNGIKLGGERYETIPLRHGATLKVGDVAFDFVLTDEEKEALAREKPPEESAITREKALPPVPQVQTPRRQVAVRPAPVVVTQEGGGGWMILLFLVLAGVALFSGLSIRHQKETGTSLVESMRARFAQQAAPASEAPAADDAPASSAAETAVVEETVEAEEEPAPEPEEEAEPQMGD